MITSIILCVTKVPFSEVETAWHSRCCWPWRARTPTEVSPLPSPPLLRPSRAQLCILMDGVAGVRPPVRPLRVPPMRDCCRACQWAPRIRKMASRNLCPMGRILPARGRPAQWCTVLSKNYSDFFLLSSGDAAGGRRPSETAYSSPATKREGGREGGERVESSIPPPAADHATTL